MRNISKGPSKRIRTLLKITLEAMGKCPQTCMNKLRAAPRHGRSRLAFYSYYLSLQDHGVKLHILTDVITAAVEFRHFVFRKVVLNDLFHAVGADDGRNADENAVFAVFAVQQGADRDDGLLIVQDGGDQAAERGTDAVFST